MPSLRPFATSWAQCTSTQRQSYSGREPTGVFQTRVSKGEGSLRKKCFRTSVVCLGRYIMFMCACDELSKQKERLATGTCFWKKSGSLSAACVFRDCGSESARTLPSGPVIPSFGHRDCDSLSAELCEGLWTSSTERTGWSCLSPLIHTTSFRLAHGFPTGIRWKQWLIHPGQESNGLSPTARSTRQTRAACSQFARPGPRSSSAQRGRSSAAVPDRC